jgi:hypothetical protein
MVTDSYIAHYFAMFIVFVIAISFSIGWAKADGTKPFSDKFDLGYIEDYPLEPNATIVVDDYDELKDLERQVKIAKLKKQLQDLNEPPEPKQTKKKAPKQQPKQPSKPAIFDDCVSALIGLGTPARKAKAEVQIIFDRNPNIKTVQEFITEYGKR